MTMIKEKTVVAVTQNKTIKMDQENMCTTVTGKNTPRKLKENKKVKIQIPCR